MDKLGQDKISHILVPLNGGHDDEQALQLACLVARKHKSQLSVLHVVEVPRAQTLDTELSTETARGEHLLEHAEELTHSLGCEAKGELLQARKAGTALVDEATRLNVDLIIMGLPFHTHFGAYQLGETSNYILNHAPCRVWLVREQAGKHSES